MLRNHSGTAGSSTTKKHNRIYFYFRVKSLAEGEEFLFYKTDEELDLFLVETLKNILEDVKECAEYSKKYTGAEYDEINEDYAFVLDDLVMLVKEVKAVQDLAQFDEEELGNVYEYIEDFAQCFVIPVETDETYQDALKEYAKLEELLDLFLDDDDADDE